MNLIELKKLVESTKPGSKFPFGISEPFSWRGSYDEVCFSITMEETTRGNILKKIKKAYNNIFYGYKGGEYTFGDYTDVNFECEGGSWSDGKYCLNMISEIQGEDQYEDNQEKLIRLILEK